jgi:hypothetical protein
VKPRFLKVLFTTNSQSITAEMQCSNITNTWNMPKTYNSTCLINLFRSWLARRTASTYKKKKKKREQKSRINFLDIKPSKVNKDCHSIYLFIFIPLFHKLQLKCKQCQVEIIRRNKSKTITTI